jgi:glycerol-1-phosphate dehydrogenase [NAD(P)+]
MDLKGLLANSFDCECGRRHEVPVRRFLYQHNVLNDLINIIRECIKAPVRSATVVADLRTWNVCGKQVYRVLERGRLKVGSLIVPDREDGNGGTDPVCDDATYRWLKAQISGKLPDVVIAVGSGVINDLCKWSSFDLNIPYVAVATAASMNGYSAMNVAAQIAGLKVVIEARPPVAVIAEPNVIENAPPDMTAAGFGDTIAKPQSNADWVMNNFLFEEYYCPFCAELLTSLEDLYLKRPDDLKHNKSEAVRGLFEALFWTGVAMTLVGTSTPASGAEHLLSHTLDMIANLRAERHDLHGRQVGLGVLFSAALYERVLNIERPGFVKLPDRIDEGFWMVPEMASAVRRQYTAKRPNVDIMREKIAQKETWAKLKAKLATTAKSPRVVKDWLLQAGAASCIADIACSRKRLKQAALHMHEIRARCTVIDLAWLLGILPSAVDEIIDEWLIS